MFAFFERVKVFVLKHKCLLSVLAVFFYLTWEMWFVKIVTPIRCKMWEGKEIEVFMTPEEWRKASGVNESLVGTEWVYYPTIEGEPEADPFFMKYQGLYQPVMYFNGKKHNLGSINSKYPNLNYYHYINPKTYFGHDVFVLYDQKLQKNIVQYNIISGYFKTHLSGVVENIRCNDNAFLDGDSLIENYLN